MLMRRVNGLALIASVTVCLLLGAGGLQWALAEEKGFISVKGAKFELAGEIEWEFEDTTRDSKDGGVDEREGHFQVDKMVLQPKIKFENHLKLSAQIYILEGTASLNEVHAKFTDLDLPGKMWLDVGLYERWIKSHSKRTTEAYPLIGTAFWRDDANTVTVGGEYEDFYWMLSAGNGFSMANKQPAEDSSYKILHDNYSTSDFWRMESGVNLGFKHDLGKSGKIDVLAFYYTDELSNNDITALQGYVSSTAFTYTSDKRDKNRVGGGIDYRIKNIRVYGQYIKAVDGKLDRAGWYAQVSCKHKFADRKSFTAIEPLIRIGRLDVDWENTRSNPETWDREKTTIALITDFCKNVKIKTEYYMNGEDTGKDPITGRDDVENNEWLMQLEIKF